MPTRYRLEEVVPDALCHPCDQVVGLEELRFAFSRSLTRWIEGRLGIRPPDSEDVLQSVWMRASEGYRPATKGVTPQSPSTWMYALTHRCVHDFRRTERRHGRGREPEEAAAQLDDGAPSPSERVWHTQRKVRYDAAVASLPPHHRDIYQLHFQEGIAIGEIAAQLGRPFGTIASRAKRARAGVLQHMTRALAGEGVVAAEAEAEADVAEAEQGPRRRAGGGS